MSRLAIVFLMLPIGCSETAMMTAPTRAALAKHAPIAAVATPTAQPTVEPLPAIDFTQLPADQGRVRVEESLVEGGLLWRTFFGCGERWELVFTAAVPLSSIQFDREIRPKVSWYDRSEGMMYAAAPYRVHGVPYDCAE